jgi:uncharacterized repeat protein (TIGR03803 family)
MQRNGDCLTSGNNASRTLARVLAVLAVVLLMNGTSLASSEIVLHAFIPDPKGAFPYAGLIADAAGNLDGTSGGGGAFGQGTVFKLTPKPLGGWRETVLYSFAGNGDGMLPVAALVFDGAGNLYGTTEYGGSLTCGYEQGCGTVFELSPGRDGRWRETVITTFQNEADGTWPTSSLVIDQLGNLFGVTSQGGSTEGYGMGTVFKLAPSSKGQWIKSTIFQFSAFSAGSDQRRPLSRLN